MVQELAIRLKDKCEGYALKDIFNADEAGFFSLVAREVACRQRRRMQGRHAVKGPPDSSPVCKCYRRETDASGNRQIRCFKSCHMTSLHVTYQSNNKAWITGELFAARIVKVDTRMRRQHRLILLFLDNCGAHPHMEIENVKVIFLPPNTTSKLQPMDAGIIQNLKMVYRKKLLRHTIFLMDSASTASDRKSPCLMLSCG